MPSPTSQAAARPPAPVGRVTTLLGVVVVLAALHFGRELLIPLTLAILVSFALSAPVSWVEKWGFGRAWSISLVAGGLVLLLGGAGWVAATQMQRVVDELPNYRSSIQDKVGTLTARLAAMQAASKALVPEAIAATAVPPAQPPTSPSRPAAGTAPNAPIFVRQVEGSPTLLEQIPSALGSLLNPIGTAGLILLFAIFMLRNREDLRNRFLRLICNGDLTGTTHALTDAWQRIGRYLGIQSLINAGFGAIVAIGLFLLGVPGWALWGLLCALLRYLPYVGPLLGAALPIAMSLAVSPGWGLSIATLSMFLVLELTVNLVLEPRLYSSSAGASPFAVLIAAAIWTWLWGPVGLLVAMPLTVVVVVLGKSVPQFAFLHVLFGSDEVLTPTDRYYQRVMADDPDEAIRILEEVAAAEPSPDLYESLIVPGLIAAERDLAAGKLTLEEYTGLCENIGDSVEEMEASRALAQKIPTAAAAGPVAGGVVCVPVRSCAQEVAAVALCRLLQQAGIPCRTPSRELNPGERLEAVADGELLCIVSMPDPTLRHVRALCKRARHKRPHQRIVVVLWGANAEPAMLSYRSLRNCSDALATEVRGLVDAVRRLLTAPSAGDPEAADAALDSILPTAVPTAGATSG